LPLLHNDSGTQEPVETDAAELYSPWNGNRKNKI